MTEHHFPWSVYRKNDWYSEELVNSKPVGGWVTNAEVVQLSEEFQEAVALLQRHYTPMTDSLGPEAVNYSPVLRDTRDFLEEHKSSLPTED